MAVGAAGRLGRSAAAAPARPAGRPGAGPGPGGGRRRRRGPAGRGRLHRLRRPRRRTPRWPDWRSGRRRTGTRIVTTAIDHSSVLNAAAAAGEHAAVGVDRQGRLDLDRVDRRGRGATARRWPRSRWPTTRSAPCSPTPRRSRPASGRACRWCWTRPPRWAGSTWPTRRGWSVLTGWAGRLRRSGLGRPAGDPEPGPVAGAVPGRRLPGRPLAGRARRAGHLRGRGGSGLLAAAPAAAVGERQRALVDRLRAGIADRCPTWTWPATRCAGCRTC